MKHGIKGILEVGTPIFLISENKVVETEITCVSFSKDGVHYFWDNQIKHDVCQFYLSKSEATEALKDRLLKALELLAYSDDSATIPPRSEDHFVTIAKKQGIEYQANITTDIFCQ